MCKNYVCAIFFSTCVVDAEGINYLPGKLFHPLHCPDNPSSIPFMSLGSLDQITRGTWVIINLGRENDSFMKLFGIWDSNGNEWIEQLSGSHAPSHGNLRPSGSRPSLDWPRLPFSSERPFIVQPDLPRGSHHTCPESEDVISLCSRFWSQPRLLYDHSVRPYVLFQNLAFVLF